MINIKKILISLGLLESEIKTYVAALELGPSTVIMLSKRTRLSRQAIYDALGALTDRGIMSSLMRGKKRLYTAEHPETLLQYAQRKQKDLDTQIDKLEHMIPKLELQLNQEKPVVKLFEGKEGVKMMAEVIADLPKGGTMYELADSEAIHEIFTFDDYREYANLVQEKNIKLNGFYWGEEKRTKEENVKRVFIDQKLHKQFRANIIVSENRVFMISFSGNMYAVYIENKDIAQTMKTLFRFAEKTYIK